MQRAYPLEVCGSLDIPHDLGIHPWVSALKPFSDPRGFGTEAGVCYICMYELFYYIFLLLL